MIAFIDALATPATLGWLGSTALAICGVPQALKMFKTKRADDVSWWTLWLWYIGEFLTFTYLLLVDLSTSTLHIPLYANYLFNILVVSVLLLGKLKYSKGASNE
jgi:uncharacterized protein with PQ loop repeat